MKRKTSRRATALRNHQEKRVRGSTRRSKLVREERSQQSKRSQVVTNPSEAAKLSGTPNSLIVTWEEASGRALRASRSGQERRECARCARDKITFVVPGCTTEGGGRLTSRRWCRTNCI